MAVTGTIISSNSERCVGCKDCVKVCPSPEANVLKTLEDGRVVVDIVSDKCIACGACVRACKSKARDYDDDIEKFFKDIKERKIVMIAHPAIKSAFPGTWKAVLKWFKQNGIEFIFDGAYGADICTWGYIRSMEQGSSKKVISQICPAVVRYMEIYHREQLRDMAAVHSPLSCEAIYIRDCVKKNYAVAALTPCPAMKLEFMETGHVEYNITFKSLRDYFRRKKVDFSKSVEADMHYDFDDQVQGCMGSIYPLPGGLRYNITINMPSAVAIASDGPSVYKELDQFASTAPARHPDVFEVLSCNGGCGCGIGVGLDEDEQNVIDIKNIYREAEIEARGRRKIAMNGTDKLFKDFDNKINPRSLIRNYTPSGGEGKLITEEEKAERFALTSTAAPAAAPVQQGGGVSRKDALDMASKVSDFSTKLTADIENVYASLYNIDNANQQSASMSDIVENILSKIVGFCSQNTSIDEENLPLLVSTLEKLQTAMTSLSNNISESATGSSTIREAMQEVADATTQLNVMANDMVSTFSDKY